MDIREHLNLCKKRRIEQLIVNSVTHDQFNGYFQNDDWVYNVTYAFRDALDIKFDKKWTQGSKIGFKEGDFIRSRDGLGAVQVQRAIPTCLDENKQKLLEGHIEYDVFDIVDKTFTRKERLTCTQIEFLEILVYGQIKTKNVNDSNCNSRLNTGVKNNDSDSTMEITEELSEEQKIKDEDVEYFFDNDATDKLIGFEYQKLVALERCLEARPNDHIWIECKGDVATPDTTEEIKHHKGKHTLSDLSSDIWKTLKNYVENIDVTNAFNKLVLYTTSTISEKSIFYNWDNLKPVDKRKQLLSCKPKSGSEIDKYYQIIKKCSARDLKDILSRFTIIAEQPKVSEKLALLLDHPTLVMIDECYKRGAVQLLIGLITTAAIERTAVWKISINDFQSDVRHSLSPYVKTTVPFQYVNADEVFDRNSCNYEEFTFIKKMDEIKLKKKTKEYAVADYLRAQKSQMKLLRIAPTLDINMKLYDDEVELLMDKTKEAHSYELEECDLNTSVSTKVSRNLYYHIFDLPYQGIKGVSDTEKYYRDGRIHHNVNTTDFQWKYEEGEV